MYTGNVSSLRQLACEYAEQSIDRDTYLNNRSRLLDQLSGEFFDEEDGEQTVRLPISSVSSTVFLVEGQAEELPECEAHISSLLPELTKSSDDFQSRNTSAQTPVIDPNNKYPVKKLGRHRALIISFWVVLGLGGIAIYMISSGEIF